MTTYVVEWINIVTGIFEPDRVPERDPWLAAFEGKLLCAGDSAAGRLI